MNYKAEKLVILFLIFLAFFVGIVVGYGFMDGSLVNNYCTHDTNFTLEQVAQCKQDMQQYK